MDKYRNSSLSPSERAMDLLERMNAGEKLAQLGCCLLLEPTGESVQGDIASGVGSVAVMSAGSTPAEAAALITKLQNDIMKQSRFGIPALFHSEALTGPTHPGCISFPLPITNAASFNPENVRRMADVIRKQMHALGIRQALSPVLDVSRDFRYGRTAETYGSDPTVISEFGCAYTDGLQGENLTEGVAATAKHFLGCAQVEAGINQTRAVMDHREMDEVIARPFEAAIRKSHLSSVMNSYGEIDGSPFCASPQYLRTYLRDTLGFDGLTVSDYHSLERLIAPFHMADSKQDAAIMCMKSGMDVEFPQKFLYPELESAMADDEDLAKAVDEAVYRVLRLKFELGLFEDPFPAFNQELFDAPETDKMVRQATAETVTLLKNDGILPLTDSKLKLAVIGEPGDSLRHMYGAYTAAAATEMLLDLAADPSGIGMAGVKMDPDAGSHATQDRRDINTIIRERYPNAKSIFQALSEQFETVRYEKGFAVDSTAQSEPGLLTAAVQAAGEADAVVICVGGRNGIGKNCPSGEGVDPTTADLPDYQLEAVERISEVNPNVIIIHTDSRPLIGHRVYDKARAVIEAWLPGTFGGESIADVISGKYNPGGHLPVDIPRSSGQMPMYYYQRNGSSMDSIRECDGDFVIDMNGYRDERREAERPFGYGLSYTTFEYRDMTLNVEDDGSFRVEAEITNTGDMGGADVVQLYGTDVTASCIRSPKELLGFLRVFLNAGETKKIFFEGNLNQFAFNNFAGDYLVEKGLFSVSLSEDSATPVLTAQYTLAHDIYVNRESRTFWSNAGEMEG